LKGKIFMALLIPADINQPMSMVDPTNGTDFKLAQLYSLLDCDNIEILYLSDGRIMVLDGEGKGAKPRNQRATELVVFPSAKEMTMDLLALREAGIDVIYAGGPLNDLTGEVDYIAGSVLVCQNSEVQ
jgi:hypothetical protein